MSTVVSKYIGETERSLSAIFREAELSHSLLFFDETHSLFGKRTEVKDAHDRYANIEVNYLLQPIEHYQGLVVLATNLQKNLDEAFLRPPLRRFLLFPFKDDRGVLTTGGWERPDWLAVHHFPPTDTVGRNFECSQNKVVRERGRPAGSRTERLAQYSNFCLGVRLTSVAPTTRSQQRSAQDFRKHSRMLARWRPSMAIYGREPE